METSFLINSFSKEADGGGELPCPSWEGNGVEDTSDLSTFVDFLLSTKEEWYFWLMKLEQR